MERKRKQKKTEKRGEGREAEDSKNRERVTKT
jgi:hypothetical protein